jgi:metal-sulfur cluster biosynthetic enzyme
VTQSLFISGAREAEINSALARVCDPELDEPVTDLRFIEQVTIAASGAVSVMFRLPTYWCAANFAFLMADDMRREVSAVPWVTSVTVTLGEHMYAEKINHGLAAGLSFRDTFGTDASGELDELRQNFLVKAFQRRQEALLRHLLAEGLDAASLVALSLPGLNALALTDAGAALRQRFLERRSVCAWRGDDAAFTDTRGSRLTAADLPAYLQAAARVGINTEFNGALCRGLLAARFDEPVGEPNAEPTLRDFVRGAARSL